MSSPDDDSSRLEEFNPRETGPADVVRAALRGLDRGVRENLVWVLGSVVILTLGVWHYQPEWPGMPPALKLALVGAIGAVPFVFLGVWLAAKLDTPDTQMLSIQNPVTGDQRIKHVSPTRYEKMTVLNHNGKERDRSYLHNVIINGERGVEVDQYDPEENVAVASWQAGVSNSEIRSDRKQIKKIRKALEEEADKSMELMSTHSSILREHGQEVGMRLIRAAQGIEVPEGGQLHDNLATILEDGDPAEQLIKDGESDGESEAQSPDGDDIHARAAAQSNGHDPAAAAGGDDS